MDGAGCDLQGSALPSNQPCADDVAVKYGVDVFSDFVALVCSKDSSAKMHLRHQQLQPVSSLLSADNTSFQGAPIKNNPLEKMLYFSHGSTD